MAAILSWPQCVNGMAKKGDRAAAAMEQSKFSGEISASAIFGLITGSPLTRITILMMTSPNGHIFHVTGPLWGEPPVTHGFLSHRIVMWSLEALFDLCLNKSLQWHHNGHNSGSNHQPQDCLLNRLFRRRSKKTLKLRVTGLYVGNSPGTGEVPAQMASNAEKVSIWWHHHECWAINRDTSDLRCHHAQYDVTVL